MKYVLIFLALLIAPSAMLSAAGHKKKPSNVQIPTLAIPQDVTNAFNTLSTLNQGNTTRGQEKKTASKEVIDQAIKTIRDYCAQLKTTLTDYLILLDLINKTEWLDNLTRHVNHTVSEPKPVNSESSQGLEAIAEEDASEEEKKSFARIDTRSDTSSLIKQSILQIKKDLETIMAHYNKDITEFRAKNRTVQSMLNTLATAYEDYKNTYLANVSQTLPQEPTKPRESILLESIIPQTLENIERQLQHFTKNLELSKTSTAAQTLTESRLQKQESESPRTAAEFSWAEAGRQSPTSAAAGGAGPDGNKLTVVIAFVPLAEKLMKVDKENTEATKYIETAAKGMDSLKQECAALEQQCSKDNVTVSLPKDSPQPFEKSRKGLEVAEDVKKINKRFKLLHALEKQLKETLQCIYFKQAIKAATNANTEPTIHVLIKEIGDELRAAEKTQCTSEELTKLEEQFAPLSIKFAHAAPLTTLEKIKKLEETIQITLEVYASNIKRRYELMQETQSLKDKIEKYRAALSRNTVLHDPSANF